MVSGQTCSHGRLTGATEPLCGYSRSRESPAARRSWASHPGKVGAPRTTCHRCVWVWGAVSAWTGRGQRKLFTVFPQGPFTLSLLSPQALACYPGFISLPWFPPPLNSAVSFSWRHCTVCLISCTRRHPLLENLLFIDRRLSPQQWGSHVLCQRWPSPTARAACGTWQSSLVWGLQRFSHLCLPQAFIWLQGWGPRSQAQVPSWVAPHPLPAVPCPCVFCAPVLGGRVWGAGA